MRSRCLNSMLAAALLLPVAWISPSVGRPVASPAPLLPPKLPPPAKAPAAPKQLTGATQPTPAASKPQPKPAASPGAAQKPPSPTNAASAQLPATPKPPGVTPVTGNKTRQSTPQTKLWKYRPPMVAFQGSGLLGSYYSGVSEVLVKRGVISPNTTLAGLSGGAYAAVATKLGLTGPQQNAFWKSRLAACAQRYHMFGAQACVGRLNSVLTSAMFNHLPVDSAKKVSGQVRVAVSQLNASSTSLNDSASWVVDKWSSKEDLVSILTTTDFLPCWSGPTTYSIFRNQPAFDGGYANGFEELCPNGTKTSSCLKVSCWTVGPLADSTCSAEDCGAAAAATNCSQEWRKDRVKALYKNTGYVDSWPLAYTFERCPTSSWEGEPPNPMPLFVAQYSTTPDIYPGKYGPLPFWPPNSTTRLLACQWQSWSMALPQGMELEAMDAIYKQGETDALAWCKVHGC